MPTRQPTSQSWQFLSEDAAAILAGLREGEFEHIYPASPTLFDRFLSYLDHVGVHATLDTFPDHRQRRSIPVRLLAQTLLVRPLCAVSSLAQLGPVLSASPEVLHLLGFNAQQIAHGFRANARQRPFDEETLANFAATVTASDCLDHGLVVLPRLLAAHPQYFQGATLIVDSKGVYAPAGKANAKGERLKAVSLKVCTLSVVVEEKRCPWGGSLPLRRRGRCPWQEATGRGAPAPRARGSQHAALDAGYLDGAWLAGLHRQWGLRVGVRMREDLRLHVAGFGELERQELRRPRPPSPWREAPPPKRKGKPQPRRQVALGRNLEQWRAQESRWMCTPSGTPTPTGKCTSGRWPSSETPRKIRWPCSESGASAGRSRNSSWWRIAIANWGGSFPAHEGFARAWVHFAFLAHLLLWCFDHYQPEEPLPEPTAGGLLVIRGRTMPSFRWGDCCRSCSITTRPGSPSAPRSSPVSASTTPRPKSVALAVRPDCQVPNEERENTMRL